MEKSVAELKHMYEKCNEKPEHCAFYKPPREKEDIRFGLAKLGLQLIDISISFIEFLNVRKL